MPSQNPGAWQPDLMVHDLAIGFHQGFSVERGFSKEQLIGADPQRPPVALRPIVALALLHGLQDLRGDVVGCPHCHRRIHLWVVVLTMP